MSQTIPEYAGCLWPIDPACFDAEWQTLDDDVQQRALALASMSLEGLVAYRVGECPITVRPNTQQGSCFVPIMGGYPTFTPGVDVNGAWVNSCGSRTYRIPGVVYLPRPVGRIDEVMVDGAVLNSSDYTLVDGNGLMWTGAGPSPFPPTQDVTVPATEPGTMSVTYLNRYPVDSVGAHAAGLLAMEFARACTGKGKCRLPSGVRSVARQGVTFDIAPGLFPDGNTGIREVDAYIRRWNPKNRTSQSRVFNPDLRGPVIT